MIPRGLPYSSDPTAKTTPNILETTVNRNFAEARMIVVGATLLTSVSAFAQSSVTLYGIVDNGFSYQSNQTKLGATSGGHSVISMNQGVVYGNRLGLKGSEDLGDGTKAVFVLEQGFNIANGAQQTSGLMFSRQAYVGLSNDRYGSLTLGRQYASYFQLMSPLGPAPWLTGYFGAHPGDIDGLDVGYRANNTVLYMSPTLYGFTASASYSVGGTSGDFNAGSTWTAAMTYSRGHISLGAGFSRINNSTIGGGPWGANSTTSNGSAQAGVSALTNGYQTAQAQQRFAAGASYTFSSVLDIRAIYTNVQYIPGIGSLFRDEAIFNTAGVVVHWRPTPVWDLDAGYSYTRSTKANGIADSARYQQITLTEHYALSKRTGLYATEAYTRASGQTLGTNGAGNIIEATATIGDGFNSTPSASRNLFAAGIGIYHKF